MLMVLRMRPISEGNYHSECCSLLCRATNAKGGGVLLKREGGPALGKGPKIR